MAVFDAMYAALGSPLLRHSNADESALTYIAPDGTETSGLEAIARNDRWETEVTNNGERRIRAVEFTIQTEDVPTIHLRGRLRDSDSIVWLIRRVVSRGETLTWCECVNRTAFEETRPNLRVSQ